MRSYDYPDPGFVFPELGRLVLSALASLALPERSRVIGVGVAVPSRLGQPNELLPAPDALAGRWTGIDVRTEVERATGLPARLVGDGNAACWAEFLSRSRPLPANFAFLHIGTFLSAGLVSDWRPWEEGSTGSVDFGAMLVTDEHGTSRLVQDIASLQALKLRLRIAGASFSETVANEPSGQPGGMLADWADAAGLALAQALLNATTLLAVDLVAIDGALPHHVLERLAGATEAELHRIGVHRHTQPRIALGNLGRAGAAQGAAMLQIYRRYFSRELADLDEE